jgi:pyruvate,water dikinase
MTAQKPLTVFFKDIGKRDLPLVGGKGANLGEMTKAGFPVPNGFAVTVEAYDQFLDYNKLSAFINEVLKSIDVNNPDELSRVSETIQKEIRKAHIPDSVAKSIFDTYKKLSGKRFTNPLVAVRSSATAEDLPDASFAGQQASFMNIKGEANLVDTVRKCWASLFTARAIFYREQNNIDHKQVKISVIVQLMVQSEVSGVMFSVDPVTNDKEVIVIEAIWGLGDMIVQGQVVPDRYVVQKDTFSILSKQISNQNKMLKKVGNKTKETKVPANLIQVRKLTDTDIISLAKHADKLQKHYYFPQDIEWAKEKDKLYITQTRPVTTLKEKAKKTKKVKGKMVKLSSAPILTGVGASPGLATGHVKLVKSPKEINKVSKGDVLVAEMTSPDYVPAMKKAAAIVTDRGGMTSHAAIVSRELGVPCIVGTDDATTTLKNGDVVSVNGKDGLVFLGSNITHELKKAKKVKPVKYKTATNLYVNLAEPELANKTAKLNVDGVGLLRAEFIIANIGIHPKDAIKRKKQNIFVDKLTNNLEKFCKAFNPRPVVYRATDFKTNEYRQLPGGETWEPEESNPMMGFRGAFRYIAQPEVFSLELQAFKKVRQKYKNLWMMVPYVRSPEELAQVRKMVTVEGLFEDSSFKFWMMVELPVNVIQLQDFIDVGIDGVSVGSNDLTMLLTGTDRDNEEVARAFNERSPSVYWALRRTIRICNKNKISSSICGQAPSTYDDLVIKLVKQGITSISVSPDSVNRVRKLIHDTERHT